MRVGRYLLLIAGSTAIAIATVHHGIQLLALNVGAAGRSLRTLANRA